MSACVAHWAKCVTKEHVITWQCCSYRLKISSDIADFGLDLLIYSLIFGHGSKFWSMTIILCEDCIFDFIWPWPSYLLKVSFLTLAGILYDIFVNAMVLELHVYLQYFVKISMFGLFLNYAFLLISINRFCYLSWDNVK